MGEGYMSWIHKILHEEIKWIRQFPDIYLITALHLIIQQDYKATYDFDDNDACYVNHRQKNNNTDEDGNDIDLNENEYTNGALSRSAKGVYGKHDANSGHNGCTDDDKDFDSEEIVYEENEPSPFFQEDDEVDKCDDQSYEDGDWADENGTDYYIDDDCWWRAYGDTMRQSYLYLTICSVQYLQQAHSRLYKLARQRINC